jgi:transposase
MITYALVSQIRSLHEQGLSARQIARELKLGRRTVQRWLQRQQFQPRAPSPRPSKLDPWRGEVVSLLHLHPYTAQQLLQQLQARGYAGSYSILKRLVRLVRPKTQPAFLTPPNLAHFPTPGFGALSRDRRQRCGQPRPGRPGLDSDASYH